MSKPDIEVSLWIARPPEYIWTYLCNVSNEVLWRYGVLFAEWISDPPFGIGSIGLHIIEGMGDYPWQVCQWDEFRDIRWDVLDGRFKGARAGYRITPDGEGNRVSIYVYTNRNIFLKIMTVIMKGFFKRQLTGDLERLKATLES